MRELLSRPPVQISDQQETLIRSNGAQRFVRKTSAHQSCYVLLDTSLLVLAVANPTSSSFTYRETWLSRQTYKPAREYSSIKDYSGMGLSSLVKYSRVRRCPQQAVPTDLVQFFSSATQKPQPPTIDHAFIRL